MSIRLINLHYLKVTSSHHDMTKFYNDSVTWQSPWSQLLSLGRSRVEWPIKFSECILWSAITNPWSHQPIRLKYDEVIMVWCHHGPMRAEPKHLTHWMKQVCTSVNKPIPACIICRPDQKSSLYKIHSKSSLEFGLQSRQDLTKCIMSQVCTYTSHIRPVFKRGGPTTQRLETWHIRMFCLILTNHTYCCPWSPLTRLLLTRYDNGSLHWRRHRTMDTPPLTTTYLPRRREQHPSGHWPRSPHG